MSGYVIAEVWCDLCGTREVAADEGPLRALRAELRDAGWQRVRPSTTEDHQAARRHGTGMRLLDVCPNCAETRAAVLDAT